MYGRCLDLGRPRHHFMSEATLLSIGSHSLVSLLSAPIVPSLSSPSPCRSAPTILCHHSTPVGSREPLFQRWTRRRPAEMKQAHKPLLPSKGLWAANQR